jgi:hypothetical protein
LIVSLATALVISHVLQSRTCSAHQLRANTS